MTGMRVAVLVVGAGLAASASGEIIELIGPDGTPSGWQAEIFTDNVELVVNSVDGGVMHLEKIATFTEIDEFTGQPKPINITFSQIDSDDNTVTQFVIDQETITNMTGQDWVDFESILVDSGDATWDPEAMADLDISPFTGSAFLQSNTIFHTFDGTVADGTVWTPGAAQGDFVINIDLSDDNPKVFSLKESPSVPAPGALALLGLGGVIAGRRRR